MSMNRCCGPPKCGTFSSNLLTCSLSCQIYSPIRQHPPPAVWKFAVSGDSRNCGDIMMPAIAAGVRADGAEFYWHLGDFRAMSNFDEDYRRTHPAGEYLEVPQGRMARLHPASADAFRRPAGLSRDRQSRTGRAHDARAIRRPVCRLAEPAGHCSGNASPTIRPTIC